MTAPHDAPDARPRVGDEDRAFICRNADRGTLASDLALDLRDSRAREKAQAATIADLTEKVKRLEEEVDRLSDENSELRQVPWPEWAEKCLRIIRDCSGNTDQECDLPEELEELLSEWDKADAAIARADTAERALATAQERITEMEAKGVSLAVGIVAAEQANYSRDGSAWKVLELTINSLRAFLHPEPRHD